MIFSTNALSIGAPSATTSPRAEVGGILGTPARSTAGHHTYRRQIG